MKISIIIAMYNKYDYLYCVLKSLSQQTYNDFEVIIAEDCEKNEMLENLRIWREGVELKNRIEQYRKPIGLSQHRLGKKIGVSRTSINLIETGKTIPTLITAIHIADALGVCVYKVFDLDNTEKYECPCCNHIN